MLIAEDLLLLLTDDDSGKLAASSAAVDIGLGGALLAELAWLGLADLTREGEGRKGRLVVRDGPTPGDELLAEALFVVMGKAGKKPEAVVGRLGRGVRIRLYERMVERGVLRGEQVKVLGIFPTSRWPTADRAHEREVRMRLDQALLLGLPPEPRLAAVVALLWALRSVHKVVDRQERDLSRRALDRRAKQVSQGQWAAVAVRKAADTMAAGAAGGAG